MVTDQQERRRVNRLIDADKFTNFTSAKVMKQGLSMPLQMS